MNKLRWLGILMITAILGITGFQLYWLKQNYDREEKNLSLKTDIAFREAIMELQASKLKLDGIRWNNADSSNGKMRIMMKNHEGPVLNRLPPGREMISTINIVRDKLRDSLKGKPEIKSGVIISMDKSAFRVSNDSLTTDRVIPANVRKEDYVVNFLYGVDSLQDSLTMQEIDSAVTNKMKERKLTVPFAIEKKVTEKEFFEPVMNEVTVGFAKPVTYVLKQGNTFSYLLKQITQPILFSLLLLVITILSFVLLYRNLLKQRRLTELKNEFISNITHELKTPVATVGVAIEALKSFNAIDDPQRTKEYLDISQNELQRLNLLVDKVLKLSMFEKQEVELKNELLNLDEVAKEVLTSLKLQLEKHHAQVTITHEGDMTMRGDRLHLQSVIFNLLDNALKYSKANPVIAITLKQEENNIVLTVADNGIGVAPEYRDKIFEKFFRVPHGDTHNAKGYGLGLSYVAQVIEKHKGTIEAESKPGEGTSFIITLPKNMV